MYLVCSKYLSFHQFINSPIHSRIIGYSLRISFTHTHPILDGTCRSLPLYIICWATSNTLSGVRFRHSELQGLAEARLRAEDQARLHDDLRRLLTFDGWMVDDISNNAGQPVIAHKESFAGAPFPPLQALGYRCRIQIEQYFMRPLLEFLPVTTNRDCYIYIYVRWRRPWHLRFVS